MVIFQNVRLAVKDLHKSIAFYESVLGLRVERDFGAQVILTGGISLQTLDSWKNALGTDAVTMGGRSGEIYFEEDDMDEFLAKIRLQGVAMVHPPRSYTWGQRMVRIYDPDGHIIEVGEDMTAAVGRLRDGGMTPEQIARRMDVTLEYVEKCLRQR